MKLLRNPLRLFTAALLMAVMLVVPVAEAFQCGFDDIRAELTHSASECADVNAVGISGSQGNLDRDSSPGPRPEFGGHVYSHCSHGHSHTSIADGSVDELAYPEVNLRQSLPEVLPSAASTLSEGLMRPPRA